MATYLLSLLAAAASADAVLMHNTLAATPQMGWDNWNAFGCDVSEDLLLGTAKRMVQIGLKDTGYEYVVLDDCWSNGRYDNGSLRPDFTKFPNGMAHVADQVHSLDLKYGMYSSAGFYTCGQYAGSLGYEKIDANTFAGWGVDYLKYDNCYNGGQSGTPNISYARYEKMSNALNATGRPILYSMCNWNQDRPFDWAYSIANSWRVSGDIYDSFDRADVRCPCEGYKEGANCWFPGYHCSVMNILNKVASFVHRGQPGGWNDLDCLEVGNGGMNDEEYKTHMTMWAAVKSPLIIGTDIRSLSPQSFSIYTNPAILAISQDPLGSSANQRWRYLAKSTDSHGWTGNRGQGDCGKPTDSYGIGEIQMWAGNLAHGDYVVLLLNGANQEMKINATLVDIFVDQGGASSKEAKRDWDVYDLWANRMPNNTASAILNANSTAGVPNVAKYWYNSTAKSYHDGIMANHTLLMGTKTSEVKAMGTISATVAGHGVAAYRLRPRGAPVTGN